MTDSIPPHKICTLDGFLRQFIDQHKRRPDQPFCFILGAGASRDSGIKTGGEMAEDWLRKLHEDRNHGKLSLADWIAAAHLGITDFDEKSPSKFYSQLYELLYKGKEQAGFSYLETIMEGKAPSFGYSVLSYLLSETQHRIVITTNFDNLVTDALSIHAGTFPIVVNEDSLVHYVRANVHRPLIAKIHGSLGFKPKSVNGDLTLSEDWRKALAAIFQTHTPIVIGYDGNDGSLMRLLEEAAADAPPEFIWWCYHCKDCDDPKRRVEEQPEHVKKLINSRPAEFVPIPGFDLLMLKLLTLMEKEIKDVPDLVQRLEQSSQGRLEKYRAQRDELGAKLTGSKEVGIDSPGVSTPTNDGDLPDELALLAKGAASKPWWQWQNEINILADEGTKNDLYRTAIAALPESGELLGNFANFLRTIRKDYNAAEVYYNRALEADPKLANNLGNYASFLSDMRKDHDAAEAYYKRALDADPSNVINLSNYANFLRTIREDNDAADAYYKRALKAGPNDAHNLSNYADFLADIRKDYDAAEVFHKRALEAAPTRSNILGNYASFLNHIRKEHETAETIYKRALELDPQRAIQLGNYGQFLIGRERMEEGLESLRTAWKNRKALSLSDCAEFAYSLWLVSCLIGSEESVWERVFKHSIEVGFSRPVWNFENMLAVAEKKLAPSVFDYAKALGAAFLSESAVSALEEIPRWKKLKPLDPALVNADGSIFTQAQG